MSKGYGNSSQLSNVRNSSWEFDHNDELTKLRTLKKPYAASVYGAATSCQSERSARAVEAAAELAVSQVRCKQSRNFNLDLLCSTHIPI